MPPVARLLCIESREIPINIYQNTAQKNFPSSSSPHRERERERQRDRERKRLRFEDYPLLVAEDGNDFFFFGLGTYYATTTAPPVVCLSMIIGFYVETLEMHCGRHTRLVS